MTSLHSQGRVNFFQKSIVRNFESSCNQNLSKNASPYETGKTRVLLLDTEKTQKPSGISRKGDLKINISSNNLIIGVGNSVATPLPVKMQRSTAKKARVFPKTIQNTGGANQLKDQGSAQRGKKIYSNLQNFQIQQLINSKEQVISYGVGRIFNSKSPSKKNLQSQQILKSVKNVTSDSQQFNKFRNPGEQNQKSYNNSLIRNIIHQVNLQGVNHSHKESQIDLVRQTINNTCEEKRLNALKVKQQVLIKVNNGQQSQITAYQNANASLISLKNNHTNPYIQREKNCAGNMTKQSKTLSATESDNIIVEKIILLRSESKIVRLNTEDLPDMLIHPKKLPESSSNKDVPQLFNINLSRKKQFGQANKSSKTQAEVSPSRDFQKQALIKQGHQAKNIEEDSCPNDHPKRNKFKFTAAETASLDLKCFLKKNQVISPLAGIASQSLTDRSDRFQDNRGKKESKLRIQIEKSQAQKLNSTISELGKFHMKSSFRASQTKLQLKSAINVAKQFKSFKLQAEKCGPPEQQLSPNKSHFSLCQAEDKISEDDENTLSHQEITDTQYQVCAFRELSSLSNTKALVKSSEDLQL